MARFIDASARIMFPVDGKEMLKRIEQIGRTCYKSEYKIKEGSAEIFVKNLIKRGHESVLEHCSFTAKFICDRGVSHEIVRHRLASYTQESTRYCNYANKDIEFIKPCFFDLESWECKVWALNCIETEKIYKQMVDDGNRPEEARTVLPNSLKTELIMTANLREWRHFFKLRTAHAAHPQMREVACMLLKEAKEKIPIVFDDIEG